jgi:prepilin-type N-terminal cleavage/methylation domain-containing protein
MTMTSRRGFTLIELMIALVLVLLVGGVTYGLLMNNQRVSRAQTSQVSMQDNVRAGALILGNELREIGYDEITAASAGAVAQVPGLFAGTNSDLIAIGPDSIRYRAMRALGFTCSVDPVNRDIVVRGGTSLLKQRYPTTTDRLMLYVENNPNTSGDDVWLHATINAVADDQNCPDGNPGTRFRVTFDAAAAATVLDPTHTKVGGPVRIYEVMLLRSYAVSGQTWLGMRSISDPASVIQPVLGPLSGGAGAASGLSLRYLDVGGLDTAVPNNVRSITVGLLGITDAPVRTKRASYATIDSLTLTTRVALRNTLRP